MKKPIFIRQDFSSLNNYFWLSTIPAYQILNVRYCNSLNNCFFPASYNSTRILMLIWGKNPVFLILYIYLSLY